MQDSNKKTNEGQASSVKGKAAKFPTSQFSKESPKDAEKGLDDQKKTKSPSKK